MYSYLYYKHSLNSQNQHRTMAQRWENVYSMYTSYFKSW